MHDDLSAKIKLFVLWAVSAFYWVTEALPTLIAWGTFIYTVLQIYVFCRDRVMRKKESG